MSEKAFNRFLGLFKAALPPGETLPDNYGAAKDLNKKLGFGYKKYDACVNDCVLFWKENEGLDVCPECGESQYQYDSKTYK